MEEIKVEQTYHDMAQEVIDKHLEKETAFLNHLRHDARRHNKQMMDEGSHDYSDPSVQADLSQFLQSYRMNENNLKVSTNKVDKLKRMKEKPYFGRLDFTEDGYSKENLYIGIAHLFDHDALDIVVYDWRSPIAGLYYENKYGRLSYDSPDGIVNGEVTLKRQFLFNKGQLINYIDTKDNAVDEQLLEVLSGTGNQKLHSVVETIQEKQNEIIRSDDIDLLFVRGVPGSGKSIIALHRLAYLMYHGQKKYNSSNMLILSPNQFFKSYIEDVLPELGENSVEQKTYEDLMIEVIGDHIETYGHHMDRVINGKISEFKNTENYYILLKTWFKYYLEHLHPYEDLYYHHQVIVPRQTIKNWYLKHMMKKPLSIGGDQFKARANSAYPYIQDQVKEKLKDITVRLNNHPLRTSEAVDRKLHLYNRRFKSRMKQALNLKPRQIYEMMFENKKLLRQLVDFNIPNDFFRRRNMYEDYHGIMLLHSWIYPINNYKHYKYIVVDESQDYNYVQLHLLKKLFNKGHFTILGDMNQTLHHRKNKDYQSNLYDIFRPNEMKSIVLETCYRSTEAITHYAGQFIEDDVKAFSRKGSEPTEIITHDIESFIIDQLSQWENFGTKAVIVHTADEAHRLSRKLGIPAVTGYHTSIHHPEIILPIYFAKGLEFDGVIYVSNQEKHHLYKQFAYTASTRAKHELCILKKSNH